MKYYYNEFAQNWWSKKWLDSIENIEKFKNRLPRGRTYARKGNVVDIFPKNGKIFSYVQGSVDIPYEQRINLKEFTDKEKNQIKTILKSRYDFLSSLIAGDFPQEFYDMLKSLKIDLFPEQWEDIDATCSCPDWANPCKHIASVFYIIARELDKDPLILFEMHGIDREEIIEREKEDIFLDIFKDLSTEDEEPELLESQKSMLDYIEFLNNNYQFTKKDIKKFLYKIYDNNAHKIEQLNTDENKKIKLTKDIKIDLDLKSMNLYLIFDNEKKIFEGFLEDVIDGNLTENVKDSKMGIFLKNMISYAMFIIYNSYYIPYPIKIDKEHFSMLFLPYFANDSISKFFGYLLNIFPEEINETSLSKILIMISKVIKYNLKSTDIENDLDDNILKSFITDTIIDEMKFYDKHHYKNIKNYFEPILSLNIPIRMLLSIKIVRREKYSLEIDVFDKRDPFSIEELRHYLGKDSNYKNMILRKVSFISKYVPIINEYLMTKKKRFEIYSFDLANILIDSKNMLKQLGVEIDIPSELDYIKTPEPFIFLDLEKKSYTYLEVKENLKFEIQIKIDDITISVDEYLNYFSEKSNGIFEFEGRFVINDFEFLNEIKNIKKRFEKIDRVNFLKFLFNSYFERIQIILSDKMLEFKKYFLEKLDVALPEKINVNLRKYQVNGYKWIYNNLIKGFNICLADDMGLGKTVQILTIIQKFKEEKKLKKPSLVVCPTSVIVNWKREANKFTPDLDVEIYHGSKRELEEIIDKDLIITSYGIIRHDINQMKNYFFDFVILDEAQNIKNPETSQSKSVKQLKANYKAALTGTPIENKVLELWSIYDFLMPGYLGDKNLFKKDFIEKIEKFGSKSKIKSLKNMINPFLLRRMKNDTNVIKDLPDKVVIDEYTYLSKEQEKLYQKELDYSLNGIKNKKGVSRSGNIFRLITKLKQICNHPLNYNNDFEYNVKISGKSEKTVELIENIIEIEEKALIFTQYVQMGKILKKMLEDKFNKKILFFHGGLNSKQREDLIDKFNNDEDIPVMIVSLKAGGTGLNLTAANHVIHYDLWWNPAVENQATDRVYRIGQDKKVFVHRLITTNTFEERINEIINEKKELSNELVQKGEKWITEMNDSELKKMFSLRDRY
ncbi:SNF2-related protein [Geotoga petraea]|uniref:Superfamily II DNA or RNA helicase, SNF2 family n=1 Tax=Geotoga petraea TaxID=28234 RepID=A0A1G6PCM9_9BACT|nr:SNF2-related protein [Geotoga petraea]SDC77334.1 Superfamily II DNA or RNA helicase, SNF2 family [Geotoga petraea]